MSAEPIISIIVPVYKVEAYLDRCIKSILDQTFTDFEIILVDDGSPDRCPQMCDEWAGKDPRIRAVHKANGGLSSARNAGLREACGTYVAFVDSDDWIEPEMYRRMYKLLLQNDADACLCEIRINNGKNKVKASKAVSAVVWDRTQYLDYYFRIHGESSNYSVCKGLYRLAALQGFAFIEGRNNEDVLASYWFATHFRRVVYTNEVFYNYFKNSSSITNSRFTKKSLDLLVVWDMVAVDVAQHFPEYRYACEMNQKRAYFTLLVRMYLNGYDHGDPELQELRKEWRRQVRKNFWSLMRWNMPLSRKVLLLLVCI